MGGGASAVEGLLSTWPTPPSLETIRMKREITLSHKNSITSQFSSVCKFTLQSYESAVCGQCGKPVNHLVFKIPLPYVAQNRKESRKIVVALGIIRGSQLFFFFFSLLMSSQALLAILGRLNSPLLNIGIFHTAPAALHTVPAALLSAHAALHTAPATLHTVPTSLHTAPAALYPVHIALHTAPPALNTVPAALHTVPEALYPVHAALHTAPAALYSEPATLQSVPAV